MIDSLRIRMAMAMVMVSRLLSHQVPEANAPTSTELSVSLVHSTMRNGTILPHPIAKKFNHPALSRTLKMHRGFSSSAWNVSDFRDVTV